MINRTKLWAVPVAALLALTAQATFLGAAQAQTPTPSQLRDCTPVNDQPQCVYRVDTRSPDDIFGQGFEVPGSGANDNLLDHVSGRSVRQADGTTNFVSTSTDVNYVMGYAGRLWSPAGGGRPERTPWVYIIRPDRNFYDVRASLEAANRNGSPAVRQATSDALRLYGNQAEWASRGSIAPELIQYAVPVRIVRGLPTPIWDQAVSSARYRQGQPDANRGPYPIARASNYHDGAENQNFGVELNRGTFSLGMLCGLGSTSARQKRDASGNTPAACTEPKVLSKPAPPKLIVDSVRIGDADGENPADIYGEITLISGSQKVSAFKAVDRKGSAVEAGPGDALPVKHTAIEVPGKAAIKVNLIDWDETVLDPDDEVANGTITWDPAKDSLGTHTRRVTGKNGKVDVTYRVAPDWYRLTVNEVKILNADGENPADIYGSVSLDNGSVQTFAFQRNDSNVVEVGPGGTLPLDDRSVTGGGSLYVNVNLTDYDASILEKDDEVAKGRATWSTPQHRPGRFVQKIKGQFGEVEVTYTVSAEPLKS
ncbi:hypothetical protein GCM10012275_32590 [Longimycelium tulufanense]|uniref:DUF6598 domain-containing protein n=1 Tax=Longimycelium tulufanense TaxID=907463 RepID=A0A8J3C929_9PSEU|nr:hypothetical protein [Longimycelium tulufanense]GGM58857.1 hypothetical protein GCM10012275_32590 [Longimycelium tulufanense]